MPVGHVRPGWRPAETIWPAGRRAESGPVSVGQTTVRLPTFKINPRPRAQQRDAAQEQTWQRANRAGDSSAHRDRGEDGGLSGREPAGQRAALGAPEGQRTRSAPTCFPPRAWGRRPAGRISHACCRGLKEQDSANSPWLSQHPLPSTPPGGPWSVRGDKPRHDRLQTPRVSRSEGAGWVGPHTGPTRAEGPSWGRTL